MSGEDTRVALMWSRRCGRKRRLSERYEEDLERQACLTTQQLMVKTKIVEVEERREGRKVGTKGGKAGYLSFFPEGL